MKKLILFALLAAAMSLGQPQQAAGQATKVKTFTAAELDKLLAGPDRVLLIDVRRPDEIASNGGFPVYLSIQANDLAKHLSEIPRDRLIVTVSNHANRAGIAAALLESSGFKVAGAVGAQTYASEGGKLVKKIEPPKPAAEAHK
jgi:rhodanese-related sulfurtransferase